MKITSFVKRTLLTSLLLVFILSSIAFASDEGACEPEGETSRSSEQLTMKEIKSMSDATLERMSLLSTNSIITRSVNSSYVVTPYTIKQKKTYYCGPAATLQVIKVSNKSGDVAGNTDDEKQDTLASSTYLNTEAQKATAIGKVADTLNELVPRTRSWVTAKISAESTSNKSTMQYYVCSNLSYGYGVIYLVIPKKLSYYPDSATSGHYISGSGIYYGNTQNPNDYANIQLRINDPHYDDAYYGYRNEAFNNVVDAMHLYSTERGADNFVY